MGTCHYCGHPDKETRPYGPGGADICFPCMTATPEREAAAKAVFGALLDATHALGGVTVLGREEGPSHASEEEAVQLIAEGKAKPL